jgi:hypothetical protein
MRRILALALAAVLLSLGLTAPSFAQATRTWVSGVGDDVNPCSRTAPCKTFAGAISKTATGGEISVLDPGGFGAVTITKSITINGGGELAGILSSLTNGVIVNPVATTTTAVVILRNISINGAGNGTNGIRFLAGAQLVVENVSITGVTQSGIEVAHTGTGKLIVRNTDITGGANGVKITSGSVTASLDNVSIRGATNGVDTLSGVVEIQRSVIAQNSGVGLFAEAGAISVENSTLSGNGLGVQAQTGATIRLSNNSFYYNGSWFGCGGGSITTTGDNRKGGNLANSACATTGPITLL